MSNILSAIRDDIARYEALCEKYGEEVRMVPSRTGLYPDCYGQHAEELLAFERGDKKPTKRICNNEKF